MKGKADWSESGMKTIGSSLVVVMLAVLTLTLMRTKSVNPTSTRTDSIEKGGIVTDTRGGAVRVGEEQRGMRRQNGGSHGSAVCLILDA